VRLTSRLAILAVFTAFTFAGHADTIYSTFGPGQTYGTSSYIIGTGEIAGVSFNQLIAAPFIPTETVTLSDAILAMVQNRTSTGAGPVTVFIESSMGGVPGTILDTLTQVGDLTITDVTDAAALLDFTCSSCSVLDAGTMYFLVAYQPDPSTESGWKLASSATGTIYDNVIGSPTGPWEQDPNSPTGAFEVNGTIGVPAPTPEPSSLVLLGTGILGIAGAARRKFLSHS
jgi:hypothetical protein